ncbi:nucleotidyltransferase family protein [Caenispirillum salinarum]|uniref:nucleotidyltransferase family protein n=1 Tax=Caenispirillum salinarum TaxID=859058 RepID=UPI00384E9F6D
MPTYPSYTELRARRLAERRRAALEALRDADARVHEAGGRLIVFGSLVEGRLHERSDIDVAVCGLPEGVDTDVALDVDLVLRDAGFWTDVIAERFLSPSLKERIDRNGREPSALD